MADTSGVGGAGSPGGSSGTSSTSETDGPDAASDVGGTSDSVSASEADSIGDDAESVGDDVASAVGESVVSGADAEDSLDAPDVSDLTADTVAAELADAEADEAAADEADEVAAIEEAAVAPAAAPVQEPGFFESVGTWAGQTAKGYATGAINGVLDAANLVNSGVNLGLNAVGVDYQFRTDMGIQATSPAEQAAQNAVTVASVVTGVAGVVKAAPALAGVVDDVAALTKGVLPGATGVAAVAKLGDLRPSEIAQIQAAVEELGTDLYVVGSAAKGMRRNVDTDLPLAQFGGSKAGTRSDIDYAVKSGFDDAATALDLPDMDPSWGVRGVDFLTLDNSPAIRFSPGREPEFLNGTGRIMLD
jgi:hypothetical protein